MKDFAVACKGSKFLTEPEIGLGTSAVKISSVLLDFP